MSIPFVCAFVDRSGMHQIGEVYKIKWGLKYNVSPFKKYNLVDLGLNYIFFLAITNPFQCYRNGGFIIVLIKLRVKNTLTIRPSSPNSVRHDLMKLALCFVTNIFVKLNNRIANR